MTPILNLLKNEEDQGLIRRNSFPRALILTPTRELVSQVLKVVKSLSHHVKLRSVGLVGGTKKKDERDKLASGVDVVVSTPGRFMMHKENGTSTHPTFFISHHLESQNNIFFLLLPQRRCIWGMSGSWS